MSYFHLVALVALTSIAVVMGEIAWGTIRHPLGPIRAGSQGVREHTDFQVGVIVLAGILFVLAAAGALDLMPGV